MNPCPCGYLGDARGDCRCSAESVRRYRGKISGPLLDRIDIQMQVNRPPLALLRGDAPGGESSAVVAQRVQSARQIQLARSGVCNAGLSGEALKNAFTADQKCWSLLDKATESFALSARAYQRVQRVARTVADLACEETVTAKHMAEALSLRHLDRRMGS